MHIFDGLCQSAEHFSRVLVGISILVGCLNSWTNFNRNCAHTTRAHAHQKWLCVKPWLWKTCSMKQKCTRIFSPSFVSIEFLKNLHENSFSLFNTLFQFFYLLCTVYTTDFCGPITLNRVFLFFLFSSIRFDFNIWILVCPCNNVWMFACFFPLAFHFVVIRCSFKGNP